MPARNFRDREKEKHWLPIIEKFKSSGLSGREFCRRQGIKYGLFNDWRQKLSLPDQAQNRELPPAVWEQVIVAARNHAGGVVNYCKENQIDLKLYYRKFAALRPSHPEWNALNRRGRSRKIAKTNENTAAFAEVKVIETPSEEAPSNNSIEIVLPSLISLRVDERFPLDYLVSLITALENR